LLEFRMSYLEHGYHQKGDPPFEFPPKDVDANIDANLIEIQGKNGTGKTTFLNVLALALGYLEHQEELRNKPILKRKLEELNKNKTLEYCFRLCCEKKSHVDLKIERKPGKEQKFWMSSKQIDPETLDANFDVVFLTEDDPAKVVTASRGKLGGYFGNLLKRLDLLQNSLTKHIMENDEFHDFKKKEKALTDEIEDHQENVEKNKDELKELKDKLEKVEKRSEIEQYLDLIGSKERIESEFNARKKRYDQLKDKEKSDIVHEIRRQKRKQIDLESEVQTLSIKTVQTCESLLQYGIQLSSSKLLDNDYSELNAIIKRLRTEKGDENAKMEIVDGMIDLLKTHRDNDPVPVINKPVKQVLAELYQIKAHSLSDRVSDLLNGLRKTLEARIEKVMYCEKIQEKIAKLSQSGKDIEKIEEVEREFFDAQNKFYALQKALQQNQIKLAYQWSELRKVKGDPTEIQDRLKKLDVEILTEGNLTSKCKEKLGILRDTASRKPKYEKHGKNLRNLSAAITHLKENLYQWTVILQDPADKAKSYGSVGGRGFGLAEYQRFVKAVGESLGNQFEPIAFAGRQHYVKFFDIEKNTFITKEDRQIHIDNLSTGQSKVTALDGIFKKMDPDKKKIVLIDEIAALDPENLQNVKNTLKEKFEEGSVLLAILLRPSAEMIKISGWA
jgi:ABC-type lipoprotein export system ATPase subunit